MRSYSELVTLPTLEERFDYLSLEGEVAQATFGSARFLNQAFYRSREWRDIRFYVQARDLGCDLAVPGFEIFDRPTVHHLEPITEADVRERRPCLLDPENLVLTTHDTHNAIHYGDRSLLPVAFVERSPGDTKEW